MFSHIFVENLWRKIHKLEIPSSRSYIVFSSQVSSDTMLVFQKMKVGLTLLSRVHIFVEEESDSEHFQFLT